MNLQKTMSNGCSFLSNVIFELGFDALFWLMNGKRTFGHENQKQMCSIFSLPLKQLN